MERSNGKLDQQRPERITPAQRSARPSWPWTVVLLGYFFPCLIGIGVWDSFDVRPEISEEK
jgi:hypothetical protein